MRKLLALLVMVLGVAFAQFTLEETAAVIFGDVREGPCPEYDGKPVETEGVEHFCFSVRDIDAEKAAELFQERAALAGLIPSPILFGMPWVNVSPEQGGAIYHRVIDSAGVAVQYKDGRFIIAIAPIESETP